MRGIFSVAIAAAILAGGSLVTGTPAKAADVTVAVGPGAPAIAFGYNDGYWDREHAWHQWRDRDEAARWREANREHFYERKHDAERDMGWRNERWWERR
jgi:hypothetical protein